MKSRRVLGGLLAGAFLLGFGATAFAHHLDWHNLDKSTEGARFDGRWQWHAARPNEDGGFHYKGYLFDTICGDGDNVYTKLRVEGYATDSFYGDEKCDGSGDNRKWQDVERNDYQATRTENAYWGVCRDRSFPYSDNCNNESFHR